MNPLVILMALVAVANCLPANTCTDLSTAGPFIQCISNTAITTYGTYCQSLKTSVESCITQNAGGICTIPTETAYTASPQCSTAYPNFISCASNASITFPNNIPPLPFDCSELFYLKAPRAFLGKSCVSTNTTLKKAVINNIMKCLGFCRGIKGVRQTGADDMYVVTKDPWVTVCDAMESCNASNPISTACFSKARNVLLSCQNKYKVIKNCGVKEEHPFSFCTNPTAKVCAAKITKLTNLAASAAAAAAANAAASTTAAAAGTTAAGGTTAADTTVASTAADTTAADTTVADTTVAETTTDAPTTTTVI